MMKKIIIILSILFSLMVFSCRTYKISKGDLEWQPYKEGDILIFQSNKGEQDTIIINRIKVFSNPDDPLAIFPTKIESLFVMEQQSILEIKADKKDSSIKFSLRLGNNKLRYPSVVKKVKEMNKTEKDGNNRYVIVAEEFYDNMKDRPYDLMHIYWSKEFGYLELEFKENYAWTLISFIRNGKEIF